MNDKTPLTLDELTSLCDEIRALAPAGETLAAIGFEDRGTDGHEQHEEIDEQRQAEREDGGVVAARPLTPTHSRSLPRQRGHSDRG